MALVVTLIIVGLLLVLVEFIFIPGTTVVGFLGFAVQLVGIYLAYDYYGSRTGHMVLASVILVSGLGLWIAVKLKLWKKFSLKEEISGKVKPANSEAIKEGMEGLTVSALRPSGDAIINDKTVEVSTYGSFIDSRMKVKVTKVTSDNKIIVEQINI